MKPNVVVLALILAGVAGLGPLPREAHAEVTSPTPKPMAQKDQYRCPMHPQVRSDHPGDCPICHMRLEKVKSAPAPKNDGKASPSPTSKSGERKIKFYRHPMDPSIHSKVPAKDSMGMDYIPVYEDEDKSGETSSKGEVEGHSSVQLTPEQLKLSGTRTVLVSRGDVTREIRVPGRSLGGSQISFQIFEQDLSQVKPGMEFEGEAPAFPGERLNGKIGSIESILDPMTRTARVNGSLSRSPPGGLRAESSLIGKIQVRKERVLTVPESAVLHTGDRDLVFVSDGQGSFSPRPVTLGIRSKERIEIREGLKEGESVSAGSNFLIDSESRIQATYDSPL